MADRTVFIIRDFEVDKSAGLALQFLAKFPPAGVTLNIPGIPGAAAQGRLIEDIVDPALAVSQYVIAFMDTPNANVGFELGFALGSGRHVALVCAATELPEWLNAAPLSGYLIAKGVQLPKLQKIIEQGEHVNVDGSPSSGSSLLFLSPRADEGLVGHALVARLYPEWRSPEPTGWKLQDLPRQLDGVGEVVWLITSFAESANRRDGQGNSLNAVIAGYAKGTGIPLRILKSTHHRRIVDIEDQANLFTNLDELEDLLRVAEEKRILAGVTSSRPLAGATSPRLLQKDWLDSALVKTRAVGRLTIERGSTGTCFLVSPRHVLTTHHLFSSGDDVATCAVAFERAGAGTEVIRRATNMLWASSAELDAAIIELEAPVDDASAISLSTAKQATVSTGDRIVVIGHPFGGALSFSVSDTVTISADERIFRYSTSTVPGSSGSAIFDKDWNLLGMHYASHTNRSREVDNEGIPASAILRALDPFPSVRSALGLQ